MEDQNKPQLDPTVTAELKRIIAKEPEELIDEEKAFLRARKFYLGKHSRAKFAEVLADNPQPEQPKKDGTDPKKEEKKAEEPKEEKKTESPDPKDNGSTDQNNQPANEPNAPVDEEDDDEDEDEDEKV